MAKTIGKIKRLRKGRCIVILVLLLIVISFLAGDYKQQAIADDVGIGRAFVSINVETGDTLWGLVQTHYRYQGDIRKAIYEVKQLNDLDDATIRPGQVIQIPLY